jgi:D-alanyl-D-alanine dipeptidase
MSLKHEERLAGIDERLATVIREVGQMADLLVLEGLRSPERQRELVAQGKSKTLNSRHLTGRAVDVAIVKQHGVVWDVPSYQKLAEMAFTCARHLGIEEQLVWGGTWRSDAREPLASFCDADHFEVKAEEAKA